METAEYLYEYAYASEYSDEDTDDEEDRLARAELETIRQRVEKQEKEIAALKANREKRKQTEG